MRRIPSVAACSRARIGYASVNARGWAHTVTDPLGNTTTYGYTATGKPSTVIDAYSGLFELQYPDDSETFSLNYDDLDRLTSVTDWLGNTRSTVYDAVGNVTAEVDVPTNGIPRGTLRFAPATRRFSNGKVCPFSTACRSMP